MSIATTSRTATGASFSIRNYDTDPLDYVRSGQVRVHTSDIAHLSGGQHIDDRVAGKAGTQRLGDAGGDLVGGTVPAGGADKNPHG